MKRAQNKSNLSIVSDYVAGIRPFVSVGFDPKLHHADKKEGEIWSDSNGDKWIKKNGAIQKIPKKATIICEERCVDCNADVRWGNYLDKQYWVATQRCYDCTVTHETQLKLTGKWDAYIKRKKLLNERAELLDFKSKLIETINFANDNKNKKLEYFNSDGTSEVWTDATTALKQVLKDAKKDQKLVSEKLVQIELELRSLDGNTEK